MYYRKLFEISLVQWLDAVALIIFIKFGINLNMHVENIKYLLKIIKQMTLQKYDNLTKPDLSRTSRFLRLMISKLIRNIII